MLEKILRFFERYVIPKWLYRLGQPVYHFLLAFFGNVFFGFPSRRIQVVGVTGTKGKSTTLELINAVLEQTGRRTALFSSIRRKVADESRPNSYENTMPGRFALQRFLREAVRKNCTPALIEVTSEGVVKHRHRFIKWDSVMFLNLAPEHIEAHGSFEKYREAKLDFFRYAVHSSKPRVFFFINRADPSTLYFEKIARGVERGEIVFFSVEEFRKSEIGKNLKNRWLKTDFNLENAAAAVAFARSQGVKDSIIEKALEDFKGVPGRMDFVQKKPFAIVIDYAHTPDSLEKVYKFLKGQMSNVNGQKLICVLGSAGGGRDKWKRPVMGKIAAQYCEKIILTDEDPYDENPNQILSGIKSGISNSQFLISNVYEIIDRREAIKKAVSLADEGDVVVITGKGSERWLHLAGGKKMLWNERKIVEEILKNETV